MPLLASGSSSSLVHHRTVALGRHAEKVEKPNRCFRAALSTGSRPRKELMRGLHFTNRCQFIKPYRDRISDQKALGLAEDVLEAMDVIRGDAEYGDTEDRAGADGVGAP